MPLSCCSSYPFSLLTLKSLSSRSDFSSPRPGKPET
uniref:Uncharacterized protein n=1 Tax=Arundo donax TaxID=35708 RepID=A0A0A9HV81_ARUDO